MPVAPRLLAAALAASASALAFMAPADAARPDAARGGGSDVVTHQTGVDTLAERRGLQRYWTKSRMRSAQPLGVLERPGAGAAGGPTGGGPAAQAKPGGKPDKGRPGGGGSDGVLGARWTKGGLVARTAGKVFFTLGSTNYVCSGNAVTSADESTVVTAGHCVHEGDGGGYATNFMFAPGYDGGATPYGKWVAERLHTTTQWASSGDFNFDVGMAEVAPLNGATLTDTVGSQAIAFNRSRGAFVYSFGYPAARKYDGQQLSYCSGTTTSDTLGGSSTMRLTCDMTGGSSGGPWLMDFSEATGAGTQISVNSFTYRGEKNAMYGPYFGDTIRNLYNAVSAVN